MNGTLYSISQLSEGVREPVMAAQKQQNFQTFSIGSVVLFCVSVLYLVQDSVAPGAPEFAWRIGWYNLLFGASAGASLLFFLAFRLCHDRIPVRAELNLAIGFSFLVIFLTTCLTWLDLFEGREYTGIFAGLLAICVLLSASPLVYFALTAWGLLVFSVGFFWFHGGQGLAGYTPAVLATVLSTILGLVIQSGRLSNHVLAYNLEQANAELKDISFHDPLTGVWNRRFLMEFLNQQRALGMRHHFPMCVVMLDLDHFKQVNDKLGHPAGDAVLVETAHEIQSLLRDSDILARYGGEEFVVVLPHTDMAGGILVAERLRQSLTAKAFTGVPWMVSGSFGVAESFKDEEIELLMGRADKALYQAKSQGRNRVIEANGLR